MTFACQWISAISAFIAAAFWLWSAVIIIPDFLNMTLSGPKSPSGYMNRQSRLSAIAAVFAGISAIAQAIVLLPN